jgi:hypothetical protein
MFRVVLFFSCSIAISDSAPNSTIIVMVSSGVINFFDGDIQAILIYLGILIMLGGAALNDKLTKLQNDDFEDNQ